MMEVYKRYYCEMVNGLPMSDVTFTAQLYSLNLLPGDTKDQLESKHTKAEKAAHFLDNVIKPALAVNDITPFQALLTAMEKYDGYLVINLGSKIKGKLRTYRIHTYIFIIHICAYVHTYIHT